MKKRKFNYFQNPILANEYVIVEETETNTTFRMRLNKADFQSDKEFSEFLDFLIKKLNS